MERNERIFDVIILGAGASGLMCAAVATGRGKSALIIDHADKPARKLSITGGGKCNLTNRIVTPHDYVGENPHFCRSALAGFTPEHLLTMLREAGIAVEEREHGQMFCRRSAGELVDFLLRACERGGCRLALGEKIVAAERIAFTENADANAMPARFRVRTRTGVHESRSLVIAMGGPAWPQTGASGRGYELARAFGHRIVIIRPALVGLVMPDNWPLAGLAGISAPASVLVLPPLADASKTETSGKKGKKKNAEVLAADNLALLFTHRGVSGPAALQASLYWRKGCRLRLDFLPGRSVENLLEQAAGKLLCRSVIRRLLPDRLCDALLPAELGEKKIAELSRQDRDRLHCLLKTHEVAPTRSEGFVRAEVSAGGVSTEEVSSRSMESARVPGLFFCGEILDVTGRLGGYNLHWAFASGNAAGLHV